MPTMFKSSIIAIGLISALGLSACQSTPPSTQKHVKAPHQHSGKHHQSRDQHNKSKRHSKQFSEERRQKLEQRRAERKARYDALQKACEGNAGKALSVKLGEQTYNGSCKVYFKPDRAMPKKPTAATPATTLPTQLD